LLSKSTPYAEGANNCFLNQPLRWRYKQLLSESTPTLEVQTSKGCFINQHLRWRYKQLLSKGITTLEVQTVALLINSYAGGTNNFFVKAPLRWRYKHWLSKSTPYIGDTISCFLKASLRWRHNSTLVVHPYAGGTTLRWWY